MNDDSQQVVQRYYQEIFGGRNLDALDEVIAPDFVGHSAEEGTQEPENHGDPENP